MRPINTKPHSTNAHLGFEEQDKLGTTGNGLETMAFHSRLRGAHNQIEEQHKSMRTY